MTLRFDLLRTVGILFLICVCVPASADSVVTADGGDIVLTQGSRKIHLTSAHADRDPVQSPDGRVVVFTRGQTDDGEGNCVASFDREAGLWTVDVASGKAKMLAHAQSSNRPDGQLCGFTDKQFSSDGRRLYFSTPGWATSGALWVYDFAKAKPSFLLPSNGFVVLAKCQDPDFRDKLVVSQHRYFVFGGSYDWYWLFGPKGGKDLGPVGDTPDPARDACDMAIGKDQQK
ncbi:MAG: hypothetical protein ABL973_00515 [Micropepsaceae bacterium]